MGVYMGIIRANDYVNLLKYKHNIDDFDDINEVLCMIEYVISELGGYLR